MDYQLGGMTMQEVSFKRELSSLGQAININALGDWEQNKWIFVDFAGQVWRIKNAVPQWWRERQNLFWLKKTEIIDTLFWTCVTIDKNRELKVEIRINLLQILERKIRIERS